MKTKIKFPLKRTAFAMLGLALLSTAACKKNEKTAPDSNPLATNTNKTNAIGTAGPKGVCYVEVNNYNLYNVAKYSLTNGSPLFDIGIIFAANINYNTTTQTAQLFFNTQVTNVLNNRNTYIKPLQDRGIKVLLSVLGTTRELVLLILPARHLHKPSHSS